MYAVDGGDRLQEHTQVPQSSVGAPLPAVVASEGHLILSYLVDNPDPNWDGTSARVVWPESENEPVARVTFQGHYAHMFGPPNDEAFEGHPLAPKGLKPYSMFEVKSSSWIRGLERMNSVHKYHNKAAFESLRHFIFSFHDSTFECVARSLSWVIDDGSIISSLRQSIDDLAES